MRTGWCRLPISGSPRGAGSSGIDASRSLALRSIEVARTNPSATPPAAAAYGVSRDVAAASQYPLACPVQPAERGQYLKLDHRLVVPIGLSGLRGVVSCRTDSDAGACGSQTPTAPACAPTVHVAWTFDATPPTCKKISATWPNLKRRRGGRAEGGRVSDARCVARRTPLRPGPGCDRWIGGSGRREQDGRDRDERGDRRHHEGVGEPAGGRESRNPAVGACEDRDRDLRAEGGGGHPDHRVERDRRGGPLGGGRRTTRSVIAPSASPTPNPSGIIASARRHRAPRRQASSVYVIAAHAPPIVACARAPVRAIMRPPSSPPMIVASPLGASTKPIWVVLSPSP